MDDSTSAGIGRPGTRLFLSHKVKDSEESDRRVFREDTMQSKQLEAISDSSKSLSPALRSFVQTASSAGDNISLKDEETVQQSLLLAQDKGKKRDEGLRNRHPNQEIIGRTLSCLHWSNDSVIEPCECARISG